MTQADHSEQTEPQLGPTRFYIGAALFLAGFASPLLIPLVASSSLPTQWKTILSTFLVAGLPEVGMLAAVAVLGKEGFETLKQKLFSLFRKHTEAAAVGAFGSMLPALFTGKFTLQTLKDASFRTLKTVSMVMWVIFAAGCFATIYQGLGASELIQNILKAWPVNKWVILILMQITWVILGSLMDCISILLITSPVFIPVATFLGFDLLWFGILFAVNTEMGYLTPPFGVNLIVMKGIVQDTDIGIGEVYGADWPFVCLQALGLVLLLLFPGLATWLPELVFNL